jgi:hypothetical protein
VAPRTNGIRTKTEKLRIKGKGRRGGRDLRAFAALLFGD